MIPILSRLIGPEGYGTLSFVTAFALVIQGFLVFGTSTSLTVYVTALPDRDKQSREFWAIFQIVFACALLSFPLFVIFHERIIDLYFPQGFQVAHYQIGLFLILTGTANGVLYAQISNNRKGGAFSKIVAWISLAELMMTILFSFLFHVTGLLVAIVLAQAFQAIASVRLILKDNPFIPLKKAVLNDSKKYYTYGGVIFMGSLGALAIDTAGRFLIGKMLGIGELGVYQMAYGICRAAAEISSPLFASLMPIVVSSVAARDFKNARFYLEKSYRALILLYIPIVVFLSFHAPAILGLLSTKDFSRGAQVFPWIVTATAFFMTSTIYSFLLHAHQKVRFVVYPLIVGAIANLVANIVMIPKFGIVGAAAAMFIAYLITFLIMAFHAEKVLPLRPGKLFLQKAAAASIILLMIVYTATAVIDNLYVQFAFSLVLGGGAYLAFLVKFALIKEFAPERITNFLKRQLKALTGRSAPRT